MINIVTVLTASSGVPPNRRFIWAVRTIADIGAINDITCPPTANVVTLALIGYMDTWPATVISTTEISPATIPIIMHVMVWI